MLSHQRAQEQALAQIEEFNLNGNDLDDEGAAAIAAAGAGGGLPHLKELGLAGNQVGDAGMGLASAFVGGPSASWGI